MSNIIVTYNQKFVTRWCMVNNDFQTYWRAMTKIVNKCFEQRFQWFYLIEFVHFIRLVH